METLLFLQDYFKPTIYYSFTIKYCNIITHSFVLYRSFGHRLVLHQNNEVAFEYRVKRFGFDMQLNLKKTKPDFKLRIAGHINEIRLYGSTPQTIPSRACEFCLNHIFPKWENNSLRVYYKLDLILLSRS